MTRHASRRHFIPNAFPALFFAAFSLIPLSIFMAHDGPRQRTLLSGELAQIVPLVRP